MGRAIELRTDYTSAELRRLAKRGKDVAPTRRLLAIAAVLDGASRAEAAKAGGMDRQTLRDWVIRFNEQGPRRPHQQAVAGRARQAQRRAQGVPRPHRRGRSDPGNARRGALAGVRSDHAVA